MATSKIERGPTAERVAANVKQVREARRLSLEALSQRMGELGRPILRTGIAKIESGERRVDVDDLMALAIALEVTPNRLLLVSPVSDRADPLQPGGVLWLVPKVAGAAKNAWRWACGDLLLRPQILDRDPFTVDEAYAWMVENRPHRLPVRVSPGDMKEIGPLVERFEQLKGEVEAIGYDARALFDDVVFETWDTDEEPGS